MNASLRAQHFRAHTANSARDYIKFSFVLVVSPLLVLKRQGLKHLFVLCNDKIYSFICMFKKQVPDLLIQNRNSKNAMLDLDPPLHLNFTH